MNPPSNLPSYPTPTSALAIVAQSTDDASLVTRMSEGDEQALGLFYDRWHPLVHAIILRIVLSRNDAEDVVEEAFWQAWRQSRRYEPARGSVQTWLLTIARSRALDKARSLRRLREEPMENDAGEIVVQRAGDSDPSLDAESAERRAIVKKAMWELPPEQREALELGYFGGLSQSEIAERTGLPLGTVKTRMRLAMQKLRGMLQQLREEAR